MTVSRSGQIRSPNRVMSSPVLPMTVMSASGAATLRPLRKRAAPTPPAGTTIRMRTSLSADAAWRLAGDRRPEHADDAAVRYVGGFPPDIATRRGFVVISDETRRVRQPTAWLLLAGVMISVFLGLAAMLSNGWAAGVNPATLVAVAAGTMAGPSFADRAAVASHVFTAIPVTAMEVVAVLLATHIGEKVRQARRITLLAVLAQSVALFLGVITWLVSLSVPHGAAKLAFLLDGAVGIMVASAGLFFSIVTLRSRELQTPAAASQASGGYPGYGYGQPSAQYPAAAGGQYVGQAAQHYGGPPAQHYGAAAAPQYGAATAPHYSQTHGQAHSQTQSQGNAAYGQQAYGSYGQQASYPRSGYQQGYEAGYGQQQPYGLGYGPYPHTGQPDPHTGQPTDGYQRMGADAYHQAGPEGYQQAGPEGYQQPSAEGYQQPGPEGYQPGGPEGYQQAGTDSYQQYYPQQAQHSAERGAAEGSAPDDGQPLDRR